MKPAVHRPDHVAAWLILLLFLGGSAYAQTIDPHRVYEEKCSGCHSAHAGDFVWESLTVSDGELAGRKSGRQLDAFLRAGHGGLSAQETDALIEQFNLVRESGGLFRAKCRICHDSMISLARLDLIIDQGRLVGRYSGRDIDAFLHGHGRLEPAEVGTMIDVLTRALETREDRP